jgi:hypothetical protein
MRETAGQRVKRLARWAGPVAVVALGMTPALAQARVPVVVGVTSISPIVALIAGILILILPRLLNYIVAIYLIVIGLAGIMGR